MKNNVELQRRLDELTPLLAEKEAKIARFEDQKEANFEQIRNASVKIANLQVKFYNFCITNLILN